MIESLTGVLPGAAPVPRVFLQAGGSSLVVIVTALVGAVALLLRAASTHFDPSQDEEEESTVEVATSDGHGGGGGHHHSLEETVTAEVTADPGAGDIKVSRGPIDDDHGRAHKVESVTQRSATQCSHCGAVNKESGSLCWNCGSNPDAALKDDDISTINERLRKTSTDDSYVVRKDEDPRPHPVETAATPQEEEDEFESGTGTTEEDIRKEERPPIWRVWVGGFLGWLEKWQTLINTHARSMVLVTLVAGVFWSMSLVYGAARFGVSGFMALVAASVIAVGSASVAVLMFLVPGKGKTIGIGYPFTLNVVLLPPLIIAYYEPIFSVVWDYSNLTAVWILDTLLNYYGINTYLRQNYTMTNALYILMWFGISYPIGWLLGSSVYASKTYVPSFIGSIGRSLSRTKSGNSSTDNIKPSGGSDDAGRSED